MNGNLKSKFLDVKATQVDVIIELDSELDALIKAGKESLKIGHLGDVAKAELEKASKAFIATIADLDRKLETMALDPVKRDAKVKEANEVLKHITPRSSKRMPTWRCRRNGRGTWRGRST